MPRTRSWNLPTRADSARALVELAKVATMIQRMVPESRPSGSSRYRDQSCTPAIAPGCSACIRSARMPATIVGMPPWTAHAAEPTPK